MKTSRVRDFSRWPRTAHVFEVGPRDGLQSESKILPLPLRVELVCRLAEAGLSDIEVGSFVKSERIPQLENTGLVLRTARKTLLERGLKAPRFWAFVPNEYGLLQARDHEISGASFFLATSDTFCLKNVNRTRRELLKKLEGLISLSHQTPKVRFRVYLSTLVFCPYEGKIPASRVENMVNELVDLGVPEIVLSDTTGHASPLSLRKVFERVLIKHAPERFALHLHDTRGLALANIYEALFWGLQRFDSSVGGAGGCPYAPGASGNLATEDLVYMLRALRLEKKIHLKKLSEVGLWLETVLGRTLPGRMLRACEVRS